jgi:hypothetical protein
MWIRAIILTAAIVLGSPAASAGAWWKLIQVGPHERSLEIKYDVGCERVAVHKVENRRRVAIWISRRPDVSTGNHVCDAKEDTRTAKIRLSRPLAGRRVEGSQKIESEEGPYRPARNGTSYPVVPRLTGLAPSDAKILLRGLRLHAAFREVGRSTGLPRVGSQSPAPGVRDPTNRLVLVNLLG